MIKINKKNEPRELREFREKCESNGSLCKKSYEKFRDENPTGFEALQSSLTDEQHGLCCYCMKKIAPYKEKKECEEQLTVEHFKPKSKYAHLCLTYSNLLGCCRGKIGKIKHCGRSKGNKELGFIPNPAERGFDASIIEYKYNGEICINSQIAKNLTEDKIKAFYEDVETLGLNNEVLVNNRKDKLHELIKLFNEHQQHKDKRSFFEEWVREHGYLEYHAFIEYHFIKDT